jgi:hypothetical protein
MITSADTKPTDYALGVAILWVLFGCSGIAEADDELPDVEFLEYLGSWDESDEDWLLFDRSESEAMAADRKERSDPAPTGKESTESDDES